MIHTPDVEATKFWVGNLGKTATHGIVFAQLIMPDGSNMGTAGRGRGRSPRRGRVSGV